MKFNKPIEFSEAVKLASVKSALPTQLDTAQLRTLSASLQRRALVSAQVEQVKFLDRVQTLLDGALKGETSLPEMRVALRDTLAELDYAPKAGTEGTIKDLTSRARLDVLLRTNLDTARGYGQFIVRNDPALLDGYPALELVRDEVRKDPRDWEQRWTIAAQTAGDVDALRVLGQTGRMVALKNSGIWQALGDGAGGYTDTLGNPYPPFAFSSGMGVEDVDREDAQSLGLIAPDEQLAPSPLAEFNANVEMTPPVNQSLLDALLNNLKDMVTLKDGVLTFA